MASHDYTIGRDSPQPHPARSMVMLPTTYSLPSSPSRNHRPLKFTHLTLGASTGSLQRVDAAGDDPPASKKLCLDPLMSSDDNLHHHRPSKLFGTSSTALLTAMHRSMATRETPTMPNINLGSKLKDIQQQPVTISSNGSFKSSAPAVQMVPISLVSSNQGHVYVNIPSGIFSQSQQTPATAVMSTQGILAPQAFIPMATIQQESSNGLHNSGKESCDDDEEEEEKVPCKEEQCDDTTISHDVTIQSPEASNESPDASIGSPDALPGSPDALPGSPDVDNTE